MFNVDGQKGSRIAGPKIHQNLPISEARGLVSAFLIFIVKRQRIYRPIELLGLLHVTDLNAAIFVILSLPAFHPLPIPCLNAKYMK